MTDIGLILYPGLTQLDLTGPYEVLSRASNAKVHLISKTLDPVRSDRGLTILPTMTFTGSPQLEVICVPGGPGQVEVMGDSETISFVAAQGEQARFVTSVCTGALILGAAGLLRGYRATTHWLFYEDLELLGATVVKERILIDRNRVTGGGVTAGIDFGLKLVELLRGRDEAEAIQLGIEYTPNPPFNSGSPDTARPEIVDLVRRRAAALMQSRRRATMNPAPR